MAESSESGKNKVLMTVAALVAGAVAQQVVMLAWRSVRGPTPTDDEDTSLTETLVFAGLSAAAVTGARTWAMRKARREIQTS